jgi:hypothetical protein
MDINQTASTAISAAEAQANNLKQILDNFEKKAGISSDKTNPFILMDPTPIPVNPPPPRRSEPPKWLIFEDHIINTSHIAALQPHFDSSEIYIASHGDIAYTIKVKNIKEVWEKLQKVFAFGVTRQDNENTTKAV